MQPNFWSLYESSNLLDKFDIVQPPYSIGPALLAF